MTVRIDGWNHRQTTVLRPIRSRVLALFLLMACVVFVGWNSAVFAEESGGSVILEEFTQANDGFPKDWDAQRSITTAKETYGVHQEEGIGFIKAKDASQRIYTKKISWDPKTHPILTWKWRVHSVPENAEFIAAVYPSLDTDLMFIPVNTKYLWSLDKPVGSIKEGGMFGSTEIVIRSGADSTGEWVEERINVYQDFLKIHDHEPAPKAWGISLLGGPGVEVDFGSLAIHAE